MQKKIREARGITLVALVITVIILLILAGVALSLVIGENGLIKKSKESVEKYKGKAEQEEVQLGEFEQEINEYSEDKGVMKILINSGEDGIVILPIVDGRNGNYEIDWGDGSEPTINSIVSKNGNGRKIASTGNIKIAEISEENIVHEYEDKNKEYEIRIKGSCKGISYHESNSGAEKIVKILQWGETGVERIDLSNCVNLIEIAKPTKNSFEALRYVYFLECTSLTNIPENLFANCPNVTNFNYTFDNCTSLANIPENLFANCPNVTEFDYTFRECSSLINIPERLFANCQNVTSFIKTFSNCTGLTGKSIQLWKDGREGIDENNGGRNCYYGCIGLDDYNEIPNYWKNEEE